jgi:class 3 adenylate cyclase
VDKDADTLQRLAEAVEHIDRLLTARTPEQAMELTAELLLSVSGANGVIVYLKSGEELTEQWAAGQLEGGDEERGQLAAKSLEEDRPLVRDSLCAIPVKAGLVRAALVAQGGTALKGELASLLSIFSSRGLEIAALRSGSHDQRQLRVSLGRFVEPTLALCTQQTDSVLEARHRPVSVMLLDIEGLADEVNLVGPERLLPVIHQFFSSVVDTVYEHEGVILRCGLDGVTAVFGAPVATNEATAADLAAATGLQLLARLKAMTEDWGVEGLPLHLMVRAGVSSGPAMTGVFGPADRPSYTVLGPLVSLVHELAAHGSPGELVIDSSTRSLLAEHISTRSVGAVEVKGLDYPVFAYVADLTGLDAAG